MGFTPFVLIARHLWHTVTSAAIRGLLAYEPCWVDGLRFLLRFRGESSGADKEVTSPKERGIPVSTPLEN